MKEFFEYKSAEKFADELADGIVNRLNSRGSEAVLSPVKISTITNIPDKESAKTIAQAYRNSGRAVDIVYDFDSDTFTVKAKRDSRILGDNHKMAAG